MFVCDGGSTLGAIVDSDASDDGEMLVHERVAHPAKLALGEFVFDGTLRRVEELDKPERVLAPGLRQSSLAVKHGELLAGEDFVDSGFGGHGRLWIGKLLGFLASHAGQDSAAIVLQFGGELDVASELVLGGFLFFAFAHLGDARFEGFGLSENPGEVFFDGLDGSEAHFRLLVCGVWFGGTNTTLGHLRAGDKEINGSFWISVSTNEAYRLADEGAFIAPENPLFQQAAIMARVGSPSPARWKRPLMTRRYASPTSS
jgi:hypothetical protein